MLLRKRKIIFLFFFYLSFACFTKVKDELSLINKVELIEEKILEIKKEFNIDVEVIVTSSFSSIPKELTTSKKSIFISIIKEKEKVKYPIFFSKSLISLNYEKEFEAILERELSYLIDNSDYFNFIYSAIGKIVDIYIAGIK